MFNLSGKMVNIPRRCVVWHALASTLPHKVHESLAVKKTVSENKLTLNNFIFKGFAESQEV